MSGLPEIEKLSAHLPVSRELVEASAEMGQQILAAIHRTPAEWAEVDRRRQAEKLQKLAAAQAEHAAARARVDGTLAQVLDLHRPVLSESALWVECGGCEYGGCDAEPPEWPCTTWALIGEEDA